MTVPQPKYIELDFVQIEVHDNYVITNINEGVDFDVPHLDKLFEIFKIYYNGRPFVSIADRTNEYTIKPTLYKLPKFPGLLGIAVWCHSELAYNNAQFEKKFYDGPFEAFYTLEECRLWADELIRASRN